MDSSSRKIIAVNGRILSSTADPLARLEVAAIVAALRANPSIEVVLFVPDASAAADHDAGRRQTSSVRSVAAAIRHDQWDMPRAAKRAGADLILGLHTGAPLASPVPAAAFWDDTPRPGWPRLLRSIERASLKGAAVIAVDDLPEVVGLAPRFRLPPVVPSEFFSTGTPSPGGESGEAYVLCLEESEDKLPLLLAAWSWAGGPVAGSISLVLAAATARTRPAAERAIAAAGSVDAVRIREYAPSELPHLVRGASVLLHGGGRGNAMALRLALAAEVPIAAAETVVASGVVGPAGFLASPGDARRLGAACLTLLVEEPVAEGLRQRGRERAGRYRPEAASGAWIEAVGRASGRWSVAGGP